MTYRAIVLCSLILRLGYSQSSSPSVSQLEAFERFTKRSTASVSWSKEVNRIDTDQGHAVINALIVVDPTQTPKEMRGIRIDLTDGMEKDSVYTSEDMLERLIKAIYEISGGLPRLFAGASTRKPLLRLPRVLAAA